MSNAKAKLEREDEYNTRGLYRVFFMFLNCFFFTDWSGKYTSVPSWEPKPTSLHDNNRPMWLARRFPARPPWQQDQFRQTNYRIRVCAQTFFHCGNDQVTTNNIFNVLHNGFDSSNRSALVVSRVRYLYPGKRSCTGTTKVSCRIMFFYYFIFFLLLIFDLWLRLSDLTKA